MLRNILMLAIALVAVANLFTGRQALAAYPVRMQVSVDGYAVLQFATVNRTGLEWFDAELVPTRVFSQVVPDDPEAKTVALKGKIVLLAMSISTPDKVIEEGKVVVESLEIQRGKEGAWRLTPREMERTFALLKSSKTTADKP